MQKSQEEIHWFPVRVTYSREQKLKTYLDEEGIENFLPMHYVEGKGRHLGKRMLVPIIHNLLFIHSDRATIDELKKSDGVASTMRYIIDPATKKPSVISDREMHSFMLISQTNDENLIYFTDEEVKFKVGDRCVITGGIFKGAEGELVRIRGDRRVMVKLNGFMAVATTFIHPQFLEKIG